MPLQATSGAASYDAFGGGVPVVPAYIEEVFSCFLYTGNGSTQTITNGIDLSTNGGMVWTKSRSNAQNNWIFDTVRGPNSPLLTNTNGNVSDNYSDYFSPNTNIVLGTTTGYSLAQTTGGTNTNNFTYVGWTFRNQPKFFDIQTWTGTGSARTIAHNLGSVPGCIIVKDLDAGGYNWQVYHRSLTSAAYSIQLNQTAAESSQSTIWNSTAPTSTNFTVGTSSAVNGAGKTYVAYVFAHNAAGFGLTGTDNVISCGSFNANNSEVINLGYEPQWLLYKDSSSTGNWRIADTMRGLTNLSGTNAYTIQQLVPNSAAVEGENSGPVLTSTGFTWNQSGGGNVHVYIAIRRGPMKVPTSGTSVFAPVAYSGNSVINRQITTGFTTDVIWRTERFKTSGVAPAYNGNISDRLSNGMLRTNTTDADNPTQAPVVWASNTGVIYPTDNYINNATGSSYILYGWQRAPSFFDEVVAKGNDADTSNWPHNLGVPPELIIRKSRTNAYSWSVWAGAITGTGTGRGILNSNAAWASGSNAFLYNGVSTNMTSLYFSTSGGADINSASDSFVTYLFATCAGVSKVGSYTGTGALQTVNCGFTSGARFVLIKRTDSTGDWYVWDSARGITAGNDPYLLLNSSAAEVTNTNYVDTDSTGFKVTAAAPAGLNASGGTFIFLAIA